MGTTKEPNLETTILKLHPEIIEKQVAYIAALEEQVSGLGKLIILLEERDEIRLKQLDSRAIYIAALEKSLKESSSHDKQS